MEQLSNGETPTPVEVYDEINGLHEQFYSQVPNYDRTIWSPQEAFKLKTGGCMAEMLYVAGGLLHRGILKENDFSIRFSKEHGRPVSANMIGQQKPDVKHAVLMINIDDKQYECDFRLYRADEKPQFSAVTPDDEIFSNDGIEFFTLATGISEYASRIGVPLEDIPTVSELVSLHEPPSSTYDADQVRFDEDF